MLLLRAHLLDAPAFGALRSVPDGAVLLDGPRIADAGRFEDLAPRHAGVDVRDLRPAWILPGLMDLHVHLPQYEAVALDGLELLPWLETHIFPSESRFADAGMAKTAAERFFADALAWGTTTAVVYGTIHAEATDAAFQVAEACGIRAAMGKVMMDRHAPAGLRETTDASLSQSGALIHRWHGAAEGRLSYALAPRFAPMVSPELMRGAGRLAERHGAFLQTHLSENREELAWVARLFPEAANYTDVYARHGMLLRRTLLGHGIHLDGPERAAIRASGASIVHCPTSNAFLASGIMPLRRWLDEGLAVGLGTDVGAGTTLSLWHEMAMACTASKLRWADVRGDADRPLRPAEALHLATAGGARALGLEGVTGTLDAGSAADFLVVDPRVPDPAGRSEDLPERVLSRLLYRGEQAMVAATVVAGRVCHGSLA
ncbi:MAG: guanine deaminase [Holophagaceae bacterium]